MNNMRSRGTSLCAASPRSGTTTLSTKVFSSPPGTYADMYAKSAYVLMPASSKLPQCSAKPTSGEQTLALNTGTL